MGLFCLISVLAVSVVSSEDPLLIRTNLGPVRGYYKTAFHGTIYRAFEGVPYAQPPIGKLRFQPPEPLRPWEDEIVATSTAKSCMEYSSTTQTVGHPVVGSEDCLYSNIFTPILGMNDTLLPVIFFIHGGEFKIGHGSLFGPGYLLDREIIMVSFNYRLGPMGWLSTGDDVVPGNMALKDQSLALRWVSENIEAFGGDPSKITLAGHSSGGVNAHDQYLSSWSRGLFQRGITMGGTALIAPETFKDALKKSQKLAILVGCPTENTTIMETLPYGPVVESGGHNRFLEATPIEIMRSGGLTDVPWITGVAAIESLIDTISYSRNEKTMSLVNDNWETLAPFILNFQRTIPKHNQSDVARLIKEHYYGSDAITNTTLDIYANMFSDKLYKVDAVKAARIQAEVNESPVFFYVFNYRGAQSMTNVLTNSTNNYGVSHCDDLAYILEVPLINTSTTAEDIAMREFMLDFWVSYATNGTPYVGIEWPPLNSPSEALQYLHIKGPYNVSIETSTDFAEEKFWNSINFNENIVEVLHGGGTYIKISVFLYTICQLLFLI